MRAPAARRVAAIAVLLTLLGAELGAVEWVTRAYMQRISKIQRRTLADRAAARAIRAHPAGAAPLTVLMAGNSLLLEAVDYPALQNRLSPAIRPVRYTVEQTRYYDWYYALRELFRQGSRPDAVVFCLDVSDLISSSSEIPEFVANFMLGPSDLLAYSQAIHLDHTQTSTEIFAHYSWFFAARSRLRNLFLNRACPACIELIHGLIWDQSHFPPESAVEAAAEQRLRALDALCRSAHSRLVVLIPPSQRQLNLAVAAAARRAGVDVLIPVPPGAFAPTLFRDGYHLNVQGASLFTSVLASDVKREFGGAAAGRAALLSTIPPA